MAVREVSGRHAVGSYCFLFFFFRAPFRLLSAVPVHEYNGLRAGSGRWQAACEQGAASACGEDLVEVGHHSRLAIVSTRRQLEQRRREGAHGGDSQDAGPALDPSCTCSSPERRREAGRTVSCQVAEEGGSFRSEAPAYLDPNNDEARPSRARELGVSLSPFAAGGGVDGSARAGVGARLRLAGARDRADDCGIERELRSVPERQAVGDDLDAPRVAHRDVDVHVSVPDVACNARASLPTDAGDGMFERKGSRCQDTGRSARRAVVTQRVEAAAAAADARRQGERQRQASQQEHPEVFGRQGDCS